MPAGCDFPSCAYTFIKKVHAVVGLFISAWVLVLLVQTQWAMRRPQAAGRANTVPALFIFMPFFVVNIIPEVGNRDGGLSPR